MTVGDFMSNVHYGLKVGRQMVLDGLAPYVPMFDAYMFPQHDLDTYEVLLDWDFSVIRRCDALYRLRGKSPGADREVEYALANGIYVYQQSKDARHHSSLHSDYEYKAMLWDLLEREVAA
jgi:hypothetical protein